MKSRLHLYALIAGTMMAPLAKAADLTVTIGEFRSTQGSLLLTVVDSEAGWNYQAKPVAQEKLLVSEKLAKGKNLELKFTLPAGKYAVQVLHDENDNGKMDTNMLGIPSESYGYTNNPVVMRRAHFSETVFELKEPSTAVTVRLQ